MGGHECGKVAKAFGSAQTKGMQLSCNFKFRCGSFTIRFESGSFLLLGLLASLTPSSRMPFFFAAYAVVHSLSSVAGRVDNTLLERQP